MNTPEEKTFAIVGAGIVGTALAILLTGAGYVCAGVHSRSAASLARFRSRLSAPALEPAALAERAALIFVTTQDEYIAQAAAGLPVRPGQWRIHCSGSLPAAVLAPPAPTPGLRCLSLHPLQSLADIDQALAILPGTHYGVEGDDAAAVDKGKELAVLLGGVPHRIEAGQKTLYHAGAVAASNYLVALTALAVRLFELAGINGEEALASLLPLLSGSCRNIARLGLPQALTGPIARGDAGVAAGHLERMPADLRPLYRGLGRLALELGREKRERAGTPYPPAVWERLEIILAEESPDGHHGV
ncbi:MAG: DUF2520 domain-containing protein [Gracilibacteraceae bacterium]|jgi:predicted short-subunit dehydrogenase-like oxidoreductase (DUF2520 family)|nr:DUF2520 domain-containing protein [Gracilibacteraceae bacterium]